jgi:uncharacterized membrane protein
MRMPSVHGWIAIVWVLLSVWLMVQGLIIHTPAEEMPAFIRNRLDNHPAVKDLPELKQMLKPAHRVMGAVGVVVGVSAAVAGLIKQGETGEMQAVLLVLIWAVLYLPHLTTVAADVVKMKKAFGKKE